MASNLNTDYAPKPLTMDDIICDPERFGAPTFDQFKANPDKYRQHGEDILAAASDGSSILRRDVKEQIYYIGGKRVGNSYVGGYKVKSLDKVDEIARDLGLKLLDIDMKPEMEKTTGGKYIMHVYFVKKGNEDEQGEGMPLVNRGGVREDA